MPHFYPIVIQSGKSLAGDSLGFHAYSLRIDNLTNQWLLEETSLAWIPPYSLGVCLRLYGTGVAIIINQAPAGQPQPTALFGEQTVGVYSDQLRTEVAGTPVRQFALVQSVSDLTAGPQPAFPPVGVDRLYADAAGNIHHLHSNGVDLTLVDVSNAGTLLFPSFDPHYQALMNATALGGDLRGTVSLGTVVLRNNSSINALDTGATQRRVAIYQADNNTYFFNGTGGRLYFYSDATGQLGFFDGSGNLTIAGRLTFNGAFTGQTTAAVAGAPVLDWVVNINGSAYRVALKQ